MTTENPTFLNKNLINDVAQITDNTGVATDDSIKLRLFDRDVDVTVTLGTHYGNTTLNSIRKA